MIEQIQAYRCTCKCGHVWIAERTPKRCASCKIRTWNKEEDPFADPPVPKPPKPKLEPQPKTEPESRPEPEKPSPKQTKLTVCPECFALNGQHQKSCKKK